ncbi:MAG: MmcQ-like protein [Flavobacteriales bacterium]|nr:MAG: MmcQ-like protein [Flavobacteriales bacterium]
MDIETLRNYCLKKKHVAECFPFDAKILVFKVMGKMFALTNLERVPSSVNLKCDPEKALELRAHYPEIIIPGYHMSKKHWNTVLLNNRLPQKMYMELINHSYDLVVKGLPKKKKQF